MILFLSGHRPEKLPDEEKVRKRVRDVLFVCNPDIVINGLASGFDLWAADEALSLGITVWSAKPWANHEPRIADRELYNRVFDESTQHFVNNILKYPGPWIYQERNKLMVDKADKGLVWWDGSKGGTANCITYAKKVEKPIRNIYDKTLYQ